MSKKLPEIEYGDIGQKDLMSMCDVFQEVKNVYEDKAQYFFGIRSNDTILKKFELLFIMKNPSNKLEGYWIELKVMDKKRNYKVNAFACLMVEKFPNADLTYIFNALQSVQWKAFEQAGYITLSTDDLIEYKKIKGRSDIFIKTPDRFLGMVYVPTIEQNFQSSMV